MIRRIQEKMVALKVPNDEMRNLFAEQTGLLDALAESRPNWKVLSPLHCLLCSTHYHRAVPGSDRSIRENHWRSAD